VAFVGGEAGGGLRRARRRVQIDTLRLDGARNLARRAGGGARRLAHELARDGAGGALDVLDARVRHRARRVDGAAHDGRRDFRGFPRDLSGFANRVGGDVDRVLNLVRRLVDGVEDGEELLCFVVFVVFAVCGKKKRKVRGRTRDADNADAGEELFSPRRKKFRPV
jgi:hypothetical protein